MKEYKVKVHSNGTVEWFLNGLLHREDGPAAESDGQTDWWLDGKRHRASPYDEPSSEGPIGREWWYCGVRHRIQGPACEWANGKKQWFVYGNELTEDQFKTIKQIRGIYYLPLEPP